MQDAGYGLRRIPLPRTPVNKGIRKGRSLEYSEAPAVSGTPRAAFSGYLNS
jgi:hypothetical protein